MVTGVGAGAHSADDTSIVMFCVDISGSMCVTSAIQGKVALKYVHGMEAIHTPSHTPLLMSRSDDECPPPLLTSCASHSS